MTSSTLNLKLAMGYLQRGLALAHEQHLRVAFAIVDRGGHMVAAARMDGVGYLNLEVARRKAIAAMNFGAPTHDVLEAVGQDAIVMAGFQAMSHDIIVLPGGFPITQLVSIVGGLGIAGGHYSQDRMLGEQLLAGLVGE